jgi:hypothetical protein
MAMMNNAIIVLNFFEVVNDSEEKPEYDDKAYRVGYGEYNVHFILLILMGRIPTRCHKNQ